MRDDARRLQEDAEAARDRSREQKTGVDEAEELMARQSAIVETVAVTIGRLLAQVEELTEVSEEAKRKSGVLWLFGTTIEQSFADLAQQAENLFEGTRNEEGARARDELRAASRAADGGSHNLNIVDEQVRNQAVLPVGKLLEDLRGFVPRLVAIGESVDAYRATNEFAGEKYEETINHTNIAVTALGDYQQNL